MVATFWVWTSTDTKNAALLTLIPLIIGLFNLISTLPGRSYSNFYKTSRKPGWADINPAIFGVIDLLVLLPMGYATYRVYKSGGGFEFLETDVALAFYALHAVLFAVCVFLYDSKNYKLLAILKGLALIAGIGTLVTYFLIDSTAGWISIPFAIAQALCFFMALKLYQLNKNVPAKLPTTVAG